MKIELTKEQNLKFKVKIEGSKEVPSVRLNIKMKETNLLVTGTILAGVAEVKIPNLESFSDELGETTKATLEVVVDGQFYTPWSDNITIERAIKVESAIIPEEEVKEDIVSVSVDDVEVVKVESAKPKRNYIQF